MATPGKARPTEEKEKEPKVSGKESLAETPEPSSDPDGGTESGPNPPTDSTINRRGGGL